MSIASDIIAYIGGIVTSYSGDVLDLTDPTKTVYLLNTDTISANVENEFILTDEKLPYVQIVAPLCRSVVKARTVEQLALDISIQIFFRVDSGIDQRSLEAQQLKQDAAQELRVILDLIERDQIDNPSAPDFWIDAPAQVTIEKSTLYSDPGDISPPWILTASFSVNFDEEYQ